MSRPKIAVCIITCNQRAFIERCLRSVLEQEVDAELSVLVGDDASDDGTSEIVGRLAVEYSTVVSVRRRDRRLGAMANMRDLMASANGDFIARVDGDDYWLPGKLKHQLDYMQAFPGCVAVYTNAITVGVEGGRIGLFNDVGDAQFDLAGMLRRGNFLNNSSMMMRATGRYAWLDVSEPQIDYRVHLWQARQGLLGHIGLPLSAYRVNTSGSLVRNMSSHVRELYWDAIRSLPRELISDADYASGITDFLRRVFFRSVRTCDPSLFFLWVNHVYKESPYGSWRTTALVAANIMRMLGKMVIGQICGREYRRVLYRR